MTMQIVNNSAETVAVACYRSSKIQLPNKEPMLFLLPYLVLLSSKPLLLQTTGAACLNLGPANSSNNCRDHTKLDGHQPTHTPTSKDASCYLRCCLIATVAVAFAFTAVGNSSQHNLCSFYGNHFHLL